MEKKTILDQPNPMNQSKYNVDISVASSNPIFRKRIAQMINQFNLYGIDIDDVINEVTIRFHNAISKGKIIANPKAWMRSTGLNVIREKSREQRKNLIRFSDVENIDKIGKYEDKYNISSNLENHNHELINAIESLQEYENKIINLYYFEGRSWEEVALLISTEEKLITVEATRKKGERIRKKLYKILIKKFSDISI